MPEHMADRARALTEFHRQRPQRPHRSHRSSQVVACPHCGAGRFVSCTDANGKIRANEHPERTREFTKPAQ